MNPSKMIRTSNLFIQLLFIFVAEPSSIALAQLPGTFTAIGLMTTPRSLHTATLLLDGRVLIAGGFTASDLSRSPVASAELYDPSTGAFTAAGTMTTARRSHTESLTDQATQNYAGTFTFTSLDSYLLTLLGIQQGQTPAQIRALGGEIGGTHASTA